MAPWSPTASRTSAGWRPGPRSARRPGPRPGGRERPGSSIHAPSCPVSRRTPAPSRATSITAWNMAWIGMRRSAISPMTLSTRTACRLDDVQPVAAAGAHDADGGPGRSPARRRSRSRPGGAPGRRRPARAARRPRNLRHLADEPGLDGVRRADAERIGEGPRQGRVERLQVDMAALGSDARADRSWRATLRRFVADQPRPGKANAAGGNSIRRRGSRRGGNDEMAFA